MEANSVVEVRFTGGYGLQEKTFYLAREEFEAMGFGDLCKEVCARLGGDPQLDWQQLLGPRPILELQVLNRLGQAGRCVAVILTCEVFSL